MTWETLSDAWVDVIRHASERVGALVVSACPFVDAARRATEHSRRTYREMLFTTAGAETSGIGMARAFGTRLPGTAAALADGTVSRYKAEIIAFCEAQNTQ